MAVPRIAVVGAGVFGCWAAWHFLRRGASVTLVDAWGPANSRSTSGDESRIIRCVYGGQPHYIAMTDRSFAQWEELAALSGETIIRRSGALWLFGDDDSFVRDSLPHLRGMGPPVEPIDVSRAALRFPQVNWSDVVKAYFEPRAGYVLARRSIQALTRRFVEAGGEIRLAQVPARAGPHDSAKEGLRLCDGSVLSADFQVFACGPWLGAVFPDWIGPWLRPTRQEAFYFGPPPASPAFSDAMMPAWLDEARGSWYGIPGNENRGLKISCNELGPVIDPSTEDREPTPARLARAREHLAFRFPGMAGAPLLESRICQYENTPDRDLIIDRMPSDPRVIVLGGGSGHGFKMGPAVGELAAAIALDDEAPPARFSVARFSSARAAGAGQGGPCSSQQ